jgi:hypothetical protein
MTSPKRAKPSGSWGGLPAFGQVNPTVFGSMGAESVITKRLLIPPPGYVIPAVPQCPGDIAMCLIRDGAGGPVILPYFELFELTMALTFEAIGIHAQHKKMFTPNRNAIDSILKLVWRAGQIAQKYEAPLHFTVSGLLVVRVDQPRQPGC